MFEFIRDGIKAAWCWVLEFMLDACIFFIELLAENLPPVDVDFGPFLNILTQVNSWVPISYAFSLLVGYNAFLGIFIAVKLLLKLTPGVG